MGFDRHNKYYYRPKDDYDFLKRDSVCSLQIGLDGQEFKFNSLESAYQGFKCPEDLRNFTTLPASVAKQIGFKLPLRDDWDSVKDAILQRLVIIRVSEFNAQQKKLFEVFDPINPTKLDLMYIYARGYINAGGEIIRNFNDLCPDFVNEMELKRASVKENTDNLRSLSYQKTMHCMSVAEFMRDNAYKYGLEDVKDEMYVIGMLHDAGYLYGRGNHEANGSNLLSRMGLKDEYIDAIRYHGTNPLDVPSGHLSSVLTLLYEADMSIDKNGRNVGFDGRLEDIAIRYGKNHIAYETAKSEVDYVEAVLNEMNKDKVNEKDSEIDEPLPFEYES